MSDLTVKHDVDFFFWSLVKNRQFSDRNYTVIDLEVCFHPSMEQYTQRVNDLFAGYDCKGFNCFVKPVDPHEDSELWDQGVRSQLWIPYIMPSLVSKATQPSTTAVFGCIASQKALFDGLSGINPFEYFLIDEDEWVPMMSEVRK